MSTLLQNEQVLSTFILKCKFDLYSKPDISIQANKESSCAFGLPYNCLE